MRIVINNIFCHHTEEYWNIYSLKFVIETHSNSIIVLMWKVCFYHAGLRKKY